MFLARGEPFSIMISVNPAAGCWSEGNGWQLDQNQFTEVLIRD